MVSKRDTSFMPGKQSKLVEFSFMLAKYLQMEI